MLHWEPPCLPASWVLHVGVMECLLRLHKWPDGFGEDRGWLNQATQAIHDITAQHVRQASASGIPLDEHIRSVLAVPG